MTKRETTSLLTKLMGIYCLVQFAPSLVHIFSYLSRINHSRGILVWLGLLGAMIISPAVWISFCFLVIHKSDNLAKRLYPEDANASELTSLGFQEVQVLGYNFIGLLLLVQSFPQIVNLLTYSFLSVTRIHLFSHYPRELVKEKVILEFLPQLLFNLTQFILGWILFLKPKGLANLWKKAQLMRYEKREPDTTFLDEKK